MKKIFSNPMHSKTPKNARIPYKGQRVSKRYLITGKEKAKIIKQTREGLQILADHKPSGKLNKHRPPTKTVRGPRFKTQYPTII